MRKNKIIIPAFLVCIVLQGYAQETNDTISEKPKNFANQAVHVGYNTTQRLEESTASTSIIYSEDFDKRGSKNVTNSLFGHGVGLTALQGSGTFANQEAILYVRGLQSLSSNSPLILVDGIERDLNYVTPEEVESIVILKDAAAVAIYGYKGVNGVINVISKRGKYN